MPILARSIGRKIVATVVVSVGFVFVYETTIRDSRYAARQAMLASRVATPMPGTRMMFQVTAYCKGTTTASGVNVRTGIAAADPQLLPVGSVVSINTGEPKYSGIYTIMDTGPAVQGRILDVYMWSCHEALAFGRKQVEVTVLRLGWNPRASTPGLIDTLFRGREVKKGNAVPSATPRAPAAAGDAPPPLPVGVGGAPASEPPSPVDPTSPPVRKPDDDPRPDAEKPSDDPSAPR